MIKRVLDFLSHKKLKPEAKKPWTPGNTIAIKFDVSWSNFDQRRVVGHSYRPQVGDAMTCKMQSGRVAVFQITSVERCSDPHNMWFADVIDMGYEDELPPLPKPKTGLGWI